VAEDVHRPLEVDKGVQRVAVGVLHLVFGADAPGEILVCLDLPLQPEQGLGQFRFLFPEGFVRVRISGVDHGPRGEHEG
jgi:hypothetical protein